MTKMYLWYYFRAPKAVRQQLYGWSPVTAYKYIFKSIWQNSGASKRRRRSYIRDVFRAWNLDWLPQKSRA